MKGRRNGCEIVCTSITNEVLTLQIRPGNKSLFFRVAPSLHVYLWPCKLSLGGRARSGRGGREIRLGCPIQNYQEPLLNSNISFQPTSNRPQPLHRHLPTKCQSSKGERSLKEVGVSGPSAIYQAEYKQGNSLGPGGEWRKPKIHISLKSDEGLLVRKITDQAVQSRAADLGLKEER